MRPQTKFEKQQAERQLGSKAESDRKEQEKRLIVALMEVAKTPAGRMVLKALLTSFPVDVNDFSSDPYLNAFNQGTRSAAIAIRDFVKQAGVSTLRQIEDEEI